MQKNTGKSPWLLYAAILFVVTGVCVLIFVFMPILGIEAEYAISKTAPKLIKKQEVKIDKNFWIEVPKISASAPVIANVDAFNESTYQQALTKGVAHAAGTSTPDKPGNTFIFAHSAQNWLNANRFNAVFYLLYKLDKGDKFSIWYKGKKYVYEIEVKNTVDADKVSVMNDSGLGRSVTLMTCWPPGTTMQRLIIIGKLQAISDK